jgi:hypothetical protein
MSRRGGPGPDVTPELIGHLAEVAGVPLAPDRCAHLVPFVDELVRGFARLGEVDLGDEEPPAAGAVPGSRADGGTA